jgi:hypothetical protein
MVWGPSAILCSFYDLNLHNLSHRDIADIDVLNGYVDVTMEGVDHVL